MFVVLTVLSNAVAPATALATAGASDSWQETMLASRTTNGEPQEGLDEMMLKFPVQMDWMIQDNGLDLTKWFKATDTGNETSMIKRVLLELGDAGKPFQDNLDIVVNGKASWNDRRWLDLYVNACEKRRAIRLRTLLLESTESDHATRRLPSRRLGSIRARRNFTKFDGLRVSARNSGRAFPSAVAAISSDGARPGRMVRNQEPKKRQIRRGAVAARMCSPAQ